MANSRATGSQLSHHKASRYAIIASASEKFRSPGPALYGASNISLIKSSSPLYSIGSRKKIRIPNLPAANVYDLSNYRPGKTAPSYSFGGRSASLIMTD